MPDLSNGFTETLNGWMERVPSPVRLFLGITILLAAVAFAQIYRLVMDALEVLK